MNFQIRNTDNEEFAVASDVADCDGQHYVVDLETLGSDPSAVVLQIGVARLTDLGRLSGWYAWTATVEDIEWQIRRGRTISADTLAWWVHQSEEVRVRFPKAPAWGAGAPVNLTPKMAPMTDENLDFSRAESLWAWGLNFDWPILKSFLQDRYVPWTARYNIGRDARQMFEDLPEDAPPTAFEVVEGVKHTAIYDAVRTAGDVSRYLQWRAAKAGT